MTRDLVHIARKIAGAHQHGHPRFPAGVRAAHVRLRVVAHGKHGGHSLRPVAPIIPQPFDLLAQCELRALVRSVVRLAKQDGDWRVAGGGGAEDALKGVPEGAARQTGAGMCGGKDDVGVAIVKAGVWMGSEDVDDELGVAAPVARVGHGDNAADRERGGVALAVRHGDVVGVGKRYCGRI